MKRTSIEWCTHSANPIKFRRADDPTGQRGALWACVKVSAGCQNCYAATLSMRFHGGGAGFTATRMATLTPYVDDAELKAMLSPRRLPAGSKVFVEDMSDLFGEWVTDEMLDRVFAVFALRADVVFQVLTKRPERMREYLERSDVRTMIRAHAELLTKRAGAGGHEWPLPNVWLGVSAEDQEQADKRIPELLATPAAVHFLSCEPLLGPLTLDDRVLGRLCECPHDYYPYVPGDGWQHYAQCRASERKDWVFTGKDSAYRLAPGARIDWVIVGGESGPRARPCDVAWIRSIVAQCRAAGVACFVKQLGAKPMAVGVPFGRVACGACGTEDCAVGTLGYPPHVAMWRTLRDRKGSNMAEWSDDLRVREMPV